MREDEQITLTEIEVRIVGAHTHSFQLKSVSLEQSERQLHRQQTPKVSAIIAAYNEQDTIVNVIRAVEGHPLVDEIIVVDDGSSDATSERARETSANVITLPHNVGKAGAMNRGVQVARNDFIL